MYALNVVLIVMCIICAGFAILNANWFAMSGWVVGVLGLLGCYILSKEGKLWDKEGGDNSAKQK